MDKSVLSPEQQMEYYLGKDRLPNLHWPPEIPTAWSIITRPGTRLCNPTMIMGPVRLTNERAGLIYKFNNLGYRSPIDYDVEELKNQNIILILGDSDAMGRGSDYEEIYAAKIAAAKADYTVVNLGIASLSGDGMARIGVQSMMALGSAVKHVCVLWPVMSTREFVSKTFTSGTHTVSTHVPYADWFDHIDWVSNNYNYQKNHFLLQQTAVSVGAQYHELILNRHDTKSKITYQIVTSIATEHSQETEFTQLTEQSHTALANYFVRKINNRPSLFEELKTQS